MDPFVLALGYPDASVQTVGGKGANLCLLIGAGFPVPAGYVITTAAYREFVSANRLQERIVTLARTVTDSNTEEVSRKIRALFGQGTTPPRIAAAVRSAYTSFSPPKAADVHLAVRSSATVEDLPGASFAGQQETYLNVRSETELLQEVKDCWSSLWTPRALSYRLRQGIASEEVSIAVVVQLMVPALASGVTFTANPLTGERGETVIDAVWGLGDSLVGGLVTPDRFTVHKETGSIRQRTISEKMTMTIPGPTGTQMRPVDSDRRRTAVLDKAQVERLTSLGKAVESYFGSPQDIEWCLAEDGFWIVQSRPITNLPAEPDPWESPVPRAKWLKDLQAAEWATEPLSPLGATTTFAAMVAARQRKLPMQKEPWSALINGWLYIRADFRYAWLASRPAAWVFGAAIGTLNGHRRVRHVWSGLLNALDTLERTDPAGLSNRELKAHLGRLLQAVGFWWWEISWFTAAAILAEKLIGRLKVPDLPDPGRLFRGNDSLLLDAERALRSAARTGQTGHYVAEFGHFVESADPLHATLRESPDLVARQLSAAAAALADPDTNLAKARDERKEDEHLVRSVRGTRGFVARRLLALGQSHAAHVDDAVFQFQRVVALVRASFLEAGHRLKEAGIIEAADDIFFLTADELWVDTRPGTLQKLVSQRRQLRERRKMLAPPPFVPPLTDRLWHADPLWKLWEQLVGPGALTRGIREHNGRRVLVGTPGSPGRARGVARLIAGPSEFHRFQPGDVLVARTTTPVWTPLLGIAAGAVTEVGGPFSHTAIVAREFGIPLITGAINATRTVTDGQIVVIDGSAGIVEL